MIFNFGDICRSGTRDSKSGTLYAMLSPLPAASPLHQGPVVKSELQRSEILELTVPRPSCARHSLSHGGKTELGEAIRGAAVATITNFFFVDAVHHARVQRARDRGPASLPLQYNTLWNNPRAHFGLHHEISSEHPPRWVKIQIRIFAIRFYFFSSSIWLPACHRGDCRNSVVFRFFRSSLLRAIAHTSPANEGENLNSAVGELFRFRFARALPLFSLRNQIF